MKIFFITRGFPSEKDPMIGNYEAVQAKALAKLGNEVICCCVSRKKSLLHLFDYNPIQRRVSDGVTVYDCHMVLPFLPMMPHVENWEVKAGAKEYERVFRYAIDRHGKPDIIHCHCLYILQYIETLGKKYNIPLVHTEHWAELNKPILIPKVARMGNSFHSPDKILAVSNTLARSIKHFFNENANVVYNMVDNSFFKPVVDTKKNDGIFRFISVGRLVENKNFDLLIHCFHQAGFDKNISLDIVGMGDQYDKLKALIELLHLQEQVHLLGQKSPDEVSDLLTGSSAFVLTSRGETFGIAVIEAMAKGLPVISVPCGGPEEFVTPEVGIITADNKPENIIKAMYEMVQMREQFDSVFIRKYCFDNFNEECIARKIEGQYLELLRND